MKNILLFLSALIVVPAWAGDAEVAPKSSAMGMQTAPGTQTAVNIELKGSAKSVGALVADLEKEAVYKDATCSSKPAEKSGSIARITCAKADSALMTFLSKNAPAKVHWSISAAANQSASVAASCPSGCTLINCPPPSGPVQCCKKTSTGYHAC